MQATNEGEPSMRAIMSPTEQKGWGWGCGGVPLHHSSCQGCPINKRPASGKTKQTQITLLAKGHLHKSVLSLKRGWRNLKWKYAECPTPIHRSVLNCRLRSHTPAPWTCKELLRVQKAQAMSQSSEGSPEQPWNTKHKVFLQQWQAHTTWTIYKQ